MCKSCQYCLESCYWHLIEKRFCYDDDIALYNVPEKEEKNNNFFDNMAFYDCVSVIAGRSIVTIDPLPEQKPIMQQPTRRLRWEEMQKNDRNKEYLSRSVPVIFEQQALGGDLEKVIDNKVPFGIDATDLSRIISNETIEKPNETTPTITKENEQNISKSQPLDKPMDTLKPDIPHPEVRRKSLRERRMSKSLYLKIDQPKELPIIRQQSMPKFYLETPDADLPMLRTPSSALTSPVPSNRGFVYDLYSVVQMERERVQNLNSMGSQKEAMDRAGSRLALIKERIKLRRAKSTLGTSTNLPHSHHHM